MEIPLELSSRGLDLGPAIESKIRHRAERLDRFHDNINSCRVAVEQPHQSPDTGSPYRVRIDLTVPPGHEVVAEKGLGDNDLHDDLETVVIDAFDAVERQLREISDRQQQKTDQPSRSEHRALVVRLFHQEDDDVDGYGFLKTPDGREIYFHQNSVIHGDFERLAPGTEVRFEEAMGDRGPQATTVQVVNKPGKRPTNQEAEATEAPEGWEPIVEGK